MKAFEQLRTNEYLLKIFGSILKIGNCMNAGNKNRGQADGYELDALSKTFSIKDINGDSIMKTICNTIFEEDPKFADFKSQFESCYAAYKCVIDDIKRDTEKAYKELKVTSNQFDLVKKMDPDVEDLQFGKQIQAFLEESDKLLQDTIKKNEEMDAKYKDTCDYFMLAASDENRKKSEKFFKFWTDFVDDIAKVIPKP